MVISRSTNSYMRSRRSVTLQPMGKPSRILKPASDLRAFVTTGRWPAMRASSSTALVSSLRSPTASPTPMFRVTLARRGAAMAEP